MMVVVNENLFFNFLICYKGGIKKDITMRFNLILILLHSLNIAFHGTDRGWGIA